MSPDIHLANPPNYSYFRRRRRNTSGGGGGVLVVYMCTSLKLLPLIRGLLAASPASRSVSSFFQTLHGSPRLTARGPRHVALEKTHFSVIY